MSWRLRTLRVGVAAGPAASDAFTRADSASTLGTADTGQTWTAGNSGDAATPPTPGVAGNKAYFAAAGTQPDPHTWVEAGRADTTVTCTVTVPNASEGSQTAGVLGWRVDAANYLAAVVNRYDQTLAVVRNLAGTRSVLASVPFASADGDAPVLALTRSGTTLTLAANGTTYGGVTAYWGRDDGADNASLDANLNTEATRILGTSTTVARAAYTLPAT